MTCAAAFTAKTHLLSCPVKHIPAWFPLAGFQSFARQGRELSNSMRDVPFKMVKAQMVRDPQAPFSVSSLAGAA